MVEALERRTGAHVPKRQVEELSVRAAQDFDAFYAERTRAAEYTSDLLILSFDGKGIAMRHEDLGPGTRKAAETTARRLHTRLTPGEKANRKRMATAAYAFHARGSEAAETWVRQRLLVLLQGRRGGQVAKSIRKMAARR